MKENEQTAGQKRGRKVTLLSVLVIQAAVIVYTGSGICSKMTSKYEMLSFGWLLWIFLEVVCLGVYAIFWQQIIKRFDLSVAYANRALAIFWSTLWAMILFHEQITPGNLIGVVIIFAGIMLVNQEGE